MNPQSTVGSYRPHGRAADLKNRSALRLLKDPDANSRRGLLQIGVERGEWGVVPNGQIEIGGIISRKAMNLSQRQKISDVLAHRLSVLSNW